MTLKNKLLLGAAVVAALAENVEDIPTTQQGFESKIETHALTATTMLEHGYADIDPYVEAIADKAKEGGFANKTWIKDMIGAQKQVHLAFGNGAAPAADKPQQTGAHAS